jgi:hypothetical protein
MLERIRSGTEPRKFLRAEELGTMLYQSSRRPKNVILGDLSLVDFVCLRPFLECVALKERAVLQEPNKRVEYINFVETGIVSLRTLATGSVLETVCLACDALDGDVLPVTHDDLSVILGLRRTGVTEALNRFEAEGLVRKMRGVLQIRERGRLEKKACGCYGIVTKGYHSAQSVAMA